MASFGAWQNLFHQTVGHTAVVATMAVTAAHARGLLARCANNTLWGHAHSTYAKFGDFLTPPPPCTQGLQHK